MPLVPPLAGSVKPIDVAASSARRNASTELMSGRGAPFLTTRPIKAMLSLAILPSPSSFLIRGSVNSATSTASPEAMRSSTPPAVAKSRTRRLPEFFSKSGLSSCNSERSAPALSTLISAACAKPNAEPNDSTPMNAAAKIGRRGAIARDRAKDDPLAHRLQALCLVDRLVRRRGEEIDECLRRKRLLRIGRCGADKHEIRALACQVRGAAADELGDADEFVDLWLRQNRNVDGVFRGDLLFDVL